MEFIDAGGSPEEAMRLLEDQFRRSAAQSLRLTREIVSNS